MGFFKICVLSLFLMSIVLSANEKYLSEKELNFLENVPDLRCVSTNTWAPFNMKTEKKDLVGVSVDFWNLIVKKSKLKVKECEVIDNFSEVLDLIKTKKADLTISTSITKDRLKYANFSKPYASFPIVIATKDSVGFISETSNLNGKKVAVGRDYTSTKYVKAVYRDIDYVEVKNIEEALLLLESGEVYAVIDALPVLSFLIQKAGYSNLKISGATEFIFKVKIMVRNDYKELIPIINNAIDEISQEQRTKIFNKWFSVNYHEEIDHGIFIKFGLFAVIILFLLLQREKTLKKYNDKLNSLLVDLEEKNFLLKKLSITDKLTKLYNRVKIDEELKTNFELYGRYNSNFCVIILDIDDFKKVNDTFGHLVGDEVLKDFAKILRNNIRATDIIGRWGGEEFMIISPKTELYGAYKLATLLKDKISEYDFKEAGKLSASFGLSCVKKDASIKELICGADNALYRAKELGKNRVEY